MTNDLTRKVTMRRIDQLMVGDLVDLAGDRYADTDDAAASGARAMFALEYMTVMDITPETETCVCVGFDGWDACGFPPDHMVNVAEDCLSVSEIIEVAKTLFDPATDHVSAEYARGVCELIGRILLDKLGKGDGTGENASVVARMLGLPSVKVGESK